MRPLLCFMALVLLCVSDAGFAKTVPHQTLQQLPVSERCRSVHVPTGTWYAVRKVTFNTPMIGLRRYYDHTVRHKGNIFGTDYCTFERRLVYANPIGANGRSVDNDMTNLARTLLLPVDSSRAKKWICFRSKSGSCKERPSMVAGNASDALKVPSENTPQSNSPTDSHAQITESETIVKENTEASTNGLSSNNLEKTPAVQENALRAEMEKKTAELSNKIDDLSKTEQGRFAALYTESDATQDELKKVLADQTTALASEMQKENSELAAKIEQLRQDNQAQLEEIKELGKKMEVLSTQNAQKDSIMEQNSPNNSTDSTSTLWKDIGIALLGAVLGALGLFAFVSRKGTQPVPNPTSANTLAHLADPGYEPGEMIPVQIPSGLTLEGGTVEREVYMKTKGRNDPYDYWIMPQHTEAAFAGLSSDEILERVLEKPREYLVLAKNLPSHWKKCAACQKLLKERSGKRVEHVHA